MTGAKTAQIASSSCGPAERIVSMNPVLHGPRQSLICPSSRDFSPVSSEPPTSTSQDPAAESGTVASSLPSTASSTPTPLSPTADPYPSPPTVDRSLPRYRDPHHAPQRS